MSFKITKHIVLVNGVPVFIGCLTVTNEWGQARVVALVATKAHSQFEIALKQMSKSLTLYGHCQPELMYTDDMKDKGFLEMCIESLKKDIHPIDKYSSLPIFTLSGKAALVVKSTGTQIQQALGTIIEDAANSNSKPIVVGFDVKWNVDLTPGQFHIGKPAVIAIAYGSRIYILQIAQLIHTGHFPVVLKNFLMYPDILKVGRGIGGDMKHLQQAAQVDNVFTSYIDIAQLAKARRVSKTATSSLNDLCALVLHHRLDKDPDIRVSTKWENKELSKEQKQYIAIDALVSYQIYETLKAIPLPGPLPDIPHAGLSVALYQNGETLIAYGSWSSINMQSHPKVDSISVSSTRAAIDISKVIVGGAILNLHNKSLESFGAPPFTIVCKRNQLQTASAEELAQISDNEYVSILAQASADLSDSEIEQPPDVVVESWIRHFEGMDEREILKKIKAACINEEARKLCDHIFEELSGSPLPVIISRVLKDVWHAFDLIFLSKSHALRKVFARAVCDAIFIVNKEDRALVETQLKAEGSSWEEKFKYNPKWLWHRVWQTIPGPTELYNLLSAVFKLYGPLEDASSGQPLFNAAAWKSAKNLLQLVQRGYLSDPPGIPLYYQIGVDRKEGGLPIWRCCHGTNFTEGGIHCSIHNIFSSSSISAQHAVNRLNIFVLRHNLLVGTANQTGQRYKGHFDIWEYND